MTLLASAAQLRARLQDPSLDDATATQALTDASAIVRAVAGQAFDFVSQETVELVGGGAELVLPQRPVVVDAQNPLTVAEVTTNGVAVPTVEGQQWYRHGDRLIRAWPTQWQPAMDFPAWNPIYAPFRPVGVWGPRVRVTYSHGYSVVPDVLVAIVLSAAVGFVTNPQGLRSETVGGVALVWSNESVRSPKDVADRVRAELSAVGLRRGGAFSVGV